MKTPILKTKRLILRPVSLEDAPAIQRHFSTWNIIRNLAPPVPWPYPPDGAENFVRTDALVRMAAGTAFIWAITLKTEPKEAVGIVDLRIDSRSQGNRGFWLAEHLHGQGYMTEAVAAVNDFVFSKTEIDNFTVVNAKSNAASRRVKEKTGARFVRMGELLHHSGETEAEIWEVSREEWLRLVRAPG
jgi:[ribosomal protein S5]-alanine N-acetyltransferase